MNIPWQTILDGADKAADYFPPPLNIAADLAIFIARGYVERGCLIDGCTDEVKEKITAPPPEHEDFRDAWQSLKREAAGISER